MKLKVNSTHASNGDRGVAEEEELIEALEEVRSSAYEGGR